MFCMHKRRIVLTMILMITGLVQSWAQHEPFETAEDAVKNMRLGWNLGNTLDANSGDVTNMWIEKWSGRTPADYEKAWGQVPTTQALINMMRDAGINAVRVPVTWYPHMAETWKWVGGGTTWDQTNAPIAQYIDATWLSRVKETVDYVIGAGMYCVLNVHHDTGAANTAWIRASMDNYNSNHELYEWLWTQIAETFKDYDEHLIFEGYNEMLDEKNSWNYASMNYSGNYDATAANDAYDAINHYAQSFVDAVRATGGNNTTRNLMVNTYAACSGESNWSTHLKDPLTKMQLPNDAAEGHLMFQVHYYPYFSTLAEGKSSTDNLCSVLNSKLVSKGAPVVVGEWGTAGDSPVAYGKNHDIFLAWAKYFVGQAKTSGIGTFLWMGLSDGNARNVPEFNQPDLLDAMVKGYYGEDGYTHVGAPINEKGIADSEKFATALIFDLQGRKVNSLPSIHNSSTSVAAEPITQLRKGLYIINSKKFVIK